MSLVQLPGAFFSKINFSHNGIPESLTIDYPFSLVLLVKFVLFSCHSNNGVSFIGFLPHQRLSPHSLLKINFGTKSLILTIFKYSYSSAMAFNVFISLHP